MHVDEGAEDADGDEDADDGDEAIEEHEDEGVLKQRWDEEAATVALLERRLAPGHPTLAAAVAAREAAEQAWRGVRKPLPVGKRLGRAQAKLDRAYRLQDKTRAELAAFDEEVATRRGKIVEKLEEDRARVGRHRKAVEDLQEEAGAEIISIRKLEKGVGREACVQVCGGLRDAAPRFATVLAAIPEGDPAKDLAKSLVEHLHSLQARLQSATDEAGRAHEAFNIGDGDAHDEWDAWSESHDLAGDQPQRRWRPAGHGRYQPAEAAAGGGTSAERANGAAAAAAPTAAAAAADITSKAAVGGAIEELRRRANDGTARDSAPLPLRTDADVDGGEPRCKHRRGQDPSESGQAEAAVQDTRRALELHRDQAVMVAAGATSEDFIRLAAEQHARRLEAVVNAALNRGVQPIADDGQDLQMLAPEDLKKWVATHLGEDPYW